MRSVRVFVAAVSILLFTSPAVAGLSQEVSIPANQATIRLPKCLQYPDSKTYVPCTGVVPVDKITGDALDWSSLIKASPSDPINTIPVINGSTVSSTNPLPVSCANCAGGSSEGNSPSAADRRLFWNETTSPLGGNGKFTGAGRDNGGSTTGVPSKWNVFACFVTSDQPGTVIMQASNDNNGWFTVQTRSLNASVTSTYISQGMFAKYWRCQIINGSVDQTMLVMNSSFGM